MGIHGFVQSFLELQNKLCSSIKHDPLGHSMQTDYPRHIQLCYLRSNVGHLDGYEVGYLGQTIHNYPNEIISRLSPRQPHDEFHSNIFPLSLGYLQGLQQSSGSLMLGLDSLTDFTKGNILGNISLHFISPIGCLEIMVPLIPSWVHGISELVSLSKYLILQLLDVRYTDPSFVPQHTFIIFRKSG
jgi:hypothetical protein